MNGDYQLEDTIYVPFTTRAFATGIPTALVSGEVQIYEDASVTQITAAETLTVSLDSIAGFNMVSVAATAANGFGTGQSYTLILSAGTVGGVSVVGEVVGQFTIEMSAAALDLANGTDGLGAIKTDTAAVKTKTDFLPSATAGAAGGVFIAGTNAATTVTTSFTTTFTGNLTGSVGSVTGNVDGNVSGSVASVVGHTAQTGDTFALANGAAGFVAIDTVVDGLATTIGTAGDGLTAINLPDQTMNITGNITGNLSGSVGSLTGHTPQTGDTFALANGATGFAAIDTVVDQILVDTGTDIPARFDGIEGATFSTATDSLEAIRDRGDAAWTTGAGGSDRLLMVDTTIATLDTQTSFTLTAGSTDDDAYNNCTIVVEDVSTSTQKAVGMVLDYTGSTKTVTLKEALAFVIATTDKVYILAENALKSTVANRQLDVTATGAAGIDWGNVENPTTAVDLSGTDIQLADTVTTLTGHTAQTGDTYALANGASGFVAIDTVVDGIQADLSNATDGLGAIKAETALIVADTNELQTDWADGGRLDVILDASSAPTAAAVADAVWDEAQADHVAAGSFGEVATEVASILVDTGTTLDGKINTIDTNVDAILVDTGTTLPATLGTPAGADLATDIAAAQTDLDTLTAGVNVTQIAGVTAAATGLSLSADTIVNGTASGAPTTTTMISDVGITVDDQLVGRTIIFADDTTTAALRDQATDITGCTAATNTLTFTALTNAPVSGDTFVIV